MALGQSSSAGGIGRRLIVTLVFGSRNPVHAGQPPPEIDVGAAAAAERRQPWVGRPAADRAGRLWVRHLTAPG